MSKQQKLTDDRRAVRQWFAGGAAEPLVIERRQSYRPSKVLWPTFASWFMQHLRSLIVMIAAAAVISPVKIVLYRLAGAKIGRGVYIAPHVLIDPLYPQLITLADGCFLGIGCRLFTHEITAGNFRLGRVAVEAGSVIGAYATVRSGVTIGNKATIGFNSFVNRDVADGTTVVGSPAREVIRPPQQGDA